MLLHVDSAWCLTCCIRVGDEDRKRKIILTLTAMGTNAVSPKEGQARGATQTLGPKVRSLETISLKEETAMINEVAALLLFLVGIIYTVAFKLPNLRR